MTPSVPFAGVEPRLPPVLDIAQMTLLSPKLRIGPNWIGAERLPWRASGSQRFGRFVVASRAYASANFFIAGLSETSEDLLDFPHFFTLVTP